MKFIVEGKPQGKARARTFYNKRMGKMQSITPEKTKSYEDLIRWSYKAAGGAYYNEIPLKVNINAFYPIPTSFTKAKKQQAQRGELYPCVKPDCDNIIKVVLDALNGVAYYDDKQVICAACNKAYGVRGCLVVEIEALKGL